MKKIVKKVKNWTSDHKEDLIRLGCYGAGIVLGTLINEATNQRVKNRAWDAVEEASELEEGAVLVFDRDGTPYEMMIKPEED